jgi:hypothetical protein
MPKFGADDMILDELDPSIEDADLTLKKVPQR